MTNGKQGELLFNRVYHVAKRYLLEDILAIQNVMIVEVKEIQRKIHNLTVKKCWLIHRKDDKWVDNERRRQRKSYSMHSVSKIIAQHKWNQANRTKTRGYSKIYEKNKSIKILYTLHR